MRKVIFGLILLLLLTSGCSINSPKYNRNFKGESDHWIAAYSVVGSSDTRIDKAKLIYKDSDISSVGMVKFSLDANAGGIVLNQNLPESGYIVSSGADNGSIVSKNDTIAASVEWNGLTEKITLTPTNIPLE